MVEVKDVELLRSARRKNRADCTPEELKALREYNAAHKRAHDKREREERDLKKLRNVQEEDRNKAKLAAESEAENAAQIAREREEDIVYYLTGEALKTFPEMTQDEIDFYEHQIDLYLLPYEQRPFARMYEWFSLSQLGRLILSHFGLAPLVLNENKSYIIDDQGLHEYEPWKTSYPVGTLKESTETPEQIRNRVEVARAKKNAEDDSYQRALDALEVLWKKAREAKR
jgi:hypothetical protein